MMKIPGVTPLRAAIVAAALLSPKALMGATGKEIQFVDVFNDYSATDSGPAPLSENWWFYSGNAPQLQRRFGEDGTQQLILPNGVIARQLDAAVTSDFEATVELLHSNFERRQWFGLFNEDLTAGYIVAWDSRTADQEGGHGFVSIVKISAPEQKVDFLAQGETLTEAVSAPAATNALQKPFLALTLTWSKSTGELVLRSGDQELLRTSERSLENFRYLVLGGNDSAIVETVKFNAN